MKLRILFAFLVLTFLPGYDSLAIKDHVVGNYYLIALDDNKELGLFYRDPKTPSPYGRVVPNTVFAVGCDEKYIILKQHSYRPSTSSYGITNYYIVLVEKDLTRANPKNLMGPLTYEQFISKRHELNISDNLDFTKVYENLK
jgi:hypothetical protein